MRVAFFELRLKAHYIGLNVICVCIHLHLRVLFNHANDKVVKSPFRFLESL